MLFVYQYNRRISYDIGRILIMYFPYQTVNRDQFLLSFKLVYLVKISIATLESRKSIDNETVDTDNYFFWKEDRIIKKGIYYFEFGIVSIYAT